MNPPFYIHLISVPYLSWAYAHYFCSLLTPKRPYARPERILLLTGCLLLPFITIFRLSHRASGAFVLHLYFILTAVLFFEDKLWPKVTSYVMFTIIATLIELCSAEVFLIFKDLTDHTTMRVSQINEITELRDILLMSAINILIGVLVFRKLTVLLRECIACLNTKIIIQVSFPILAAIFSHIAAFRAASSRSLLLILVFWLLCLCSYPVFLRGLRNIRAAQRERVGREQQVKLLKEQLELSRKLETEYTQLRRWNHDAENHLLSLSYLMDVGKFEDAGEYQGRIMK